MRGGSEEALSQPDAAGGSSAIARPWSIIHRRTEAGHTVKLFLSQVRLPRQPGESRSPVSRALSPVYP